MDFSKYILSWKPSSELTGGRECPYCGFQVDVLSAGKHCPKCKAELKPEIDYGGYTFRNLTDKESKVYDSWIDKEAVDTGENIFKSKLSERKSNMYESPIHIYEMPAVFKTAEEINDVVQKEKEDQIIGVLQQKFEIKVDREELLKALQYDRKQYDRGYQDGYLGGIEKGMQDATSKINMNVINTELKEISSILEQCSFDGVATVRVTELIRIYHCLLNIREICKGVNEDD